MTAISFLALLAGSSSVGITVPWASQLFSVLLGGIFSFFFFFLFVVGGVLFNCFSLFKNHLSLGFGHIAVLGSRVPLTVST